MTNRGVFDNPFEEYKSDTCKNVLDYDLTGLAEVFAKKLKNYENTKLNKLQMELQNNSSNDYTVYTGSAGIALLHFLYATKNTKGVDQENLIEAFKYIPLESLKGKRPSFLCGDSGPLALAIVISYKLGPERPKELTDYRKLTEALIALHLVAILEDTPDEILYGRAGYLYALLFVNKHVGKEIIPSALIIKIVHTILRSGQSYARIAKTDSPLMWQWHNKMYLGAAHGVAGILYMLLQARAYLSANELRELVRPSLDALLALRFPGGNPPSSLGSSGGDRLVQWCHGAPGLVQLCTLAFEVFKSQAYLEAAVKCGEVVWQRGLTAKGYSICHGVAGNAYTFVQLYQTTKEPQWLYRACCFAEWCAVERRGTELHRPDRPLSLFEGLAGRLYFIHDLLHPPSASFPAFTI